MSAPDNLPRLRILLADDDADIRRTLSNYLEGRGHQVHLAETGDRALDVLRQTSIDIVITDVRMPGMDGLELLAHVRRNWPDIEVVVVTAYGDIDNAVRALREGAFDYFTKPFSVHDIAATLQRTARFRALRLENERFRERLERLDAQGRRRYGLDAIIGQSAAIQQVKDLIAQVSRTESTTVLVAGETGTGKELVARAIHYESARTRGPFVAVDCSAVPHGLVESEFYGHVKGAFTDAHTAHKGYFELADGGTLFLDEVGDMDPGMQTRLLRTLEERRVRPVGGSVEVAVDVRVVSATNRDLAQTISQGEFREDLYYRLNTFTIRIPPLRQRPEDVVPLAQHFLERYAQELRKPLTGFSPRAQELLKAHTFPGNIRELNNMVERATIVGTAALIDAEDLEVDGIAPDLPAQPAPTPEESENLDLETNEERLIRKALHRCNGNKVHASRLLGISRDALRRRMARYAISDRQ